MAYYKKEVRIPIEKRLLIVEAVAKRLASLRRKVGYKKAQLASTLNISNTHLYALMKNPGITSDEMMERIQAWIAGGCPICGNPDTSQWEAGECPVPFIEE
jgi:DNA-binding XRE family transcriptional regulator